MRIIKTITPAKRSKTPSSVEILIFFIRVVFETIQKYPSTNDLQVRNSLVSYEKSIRNMIINKLYLFAFNPVDYFFI